MPTPTFDDDPRFLQTVEEFSIEQLVAHAGIEALDISVLPWTAWRDVRRLRADGMDPRLHGLGGELRAIVRTNVTGHAAQDEQVRQHIDNAGAVETSINTDRQTLTRIFIDDIEHTELATIVRAVLHEVVRPDVVRTFSA